jgi:soluble lytic murein transglycosylase-like protein
MKPQAIILLLTLLALPAQASKSTYTEELTEYLNDFLKNYPKRLAKAKTYVPIVIDVAQYERLDPMLLATVIGLESSWRTNVMGTKGEKGLMQVHGVAADGFKLKKPEDQIRAGAKHLGLCFDKCEGDVVKALACYQTRGFCNGNLWSAKYRKRMYEDNVAKYRKTK